jgi:hypothetical protein
MTNVVPFVPRPGALLFEGSAKTKHGWMLAEMLRIKWQFEAAKSDEERDDAHHELTRLQAERASIERPALSFAEACDDFERQRSLLISDLVPGQPTAMACIVHEFQTAVVLTGTRRATIFRCSDFDFLVWTGQNYESFFNNRRSA